MAKIRAGGEAIRKFLIEHLDQHPGDIVRVATEHFGCSRQAIHRHLRSLIDEGMVTESGQTRSKQYRLSSIPDWGKQYMLAPGIAEDSVWRNDILPQLERLPENVLNIWHYGFTEMFNNVIDHANATKVSVVIRKTAAATKLIIHDNGVGIFKKIQAALKLDDARHAVLELAKGKLTTDPANHSGEGIFFSSRVFDQFLIASDEVAFAHDFTKEEDFIFQHDAREGKEGTLVSMTLHNHTARTLKKVFDQFTTDDDYGFNKTIVPVNLMHYGDDNLISRSQAKRLLTRFERFKVVMLDFSGVDSIGQAFADEVFRVFKNQYPEVEIKYINASQDVKRMISRAQHAS